MIQIIRKKNCLIFIIFILIIYVQYYEYNVLNNISLGCFYDICNECGVTNVYTALQRHIKITAVYTNIKCIYSFKCNFFTNNIQRPRRGKVSEAPPLNVVRRMFWMSNAIGTEWNCFQKKFVEHKNRTSFIKYIPGIFLSDLIRKRSVINTWRICRSTSADEIHFQNWIIRDIAPCK